MPGRTENRAPLFGEPPQSSPPFREMKKKAKKEKL